MSTQRRQGPDPTAGAGTLFYALVGGLICAITLAVLSRVHIVWT